MREIVFDTETTGLSPAGGDRMVEIGCIEMIGRVETGRHFHCYFNPERPMPSEAEAVHGLSDIFLSDKPRFADKAEELLEFIGDSPLVAHNASFDFGFLNHELERCGRPAVCMTPDGRYAGAGPLAPSRRQAQPRCALHPLRRRPLAAGQAWRAARRAAARPGLYRADRRAADRPRPGRRGAGQRSTQVVASAPSTERPVRAPRPHAASPEELARHRAFLAKIVNPLWDRFLAPTSERGAA